jgi:hypothetical protein
MFIGVYSDLFVGKDENFSMLFNQAAQSAGRHVPVTYAYSSAGFCIIPPPSTRSSP